jgi:hypothetical protein
MITRQVDHVFVRVTQRKGLVLASNMLTFQTKEVRTI